jgi:site-specific DNA recombinase
MPAECKRVALYVRVSTTRQAEADLSIPDQEREARAFCAARGWDIVATFAEPGASALDDRRPEFQRMVATAKERPRPFDVVLVHSLSRFFRDQFQSELYRRTLGKSGVELISITQSFEDGPSGDLVRSILGSFDEYQSRENAKHTLRAMRENARQGGWNGSSPPFGYQVEATGMRGARVKKQLVVNDAEAAVVRRIYNMVLGRDGVPLGVKAIASRLNQEGMTFRGKPFHISNVHRILTSETYVGTHYFNRRTARTGEMKAREDWETIAVPAIIAPEERERVLACLASRNPRKVPPRVVGSPTLLTGLARCADCGGGMTLRTGKGGRYRYYTCAARAQKGETACQGRTIRMDALDGMVLDHLGSRLLTSDRLSDLLKAWVDRSASADAARRSQLATARHRITEIDGQIKRLLELVANGTMAPDDPNLKEMLDSQRARRAAAEQEIMLLTPNTSGDQSAITEERIDRFAQVMRNALASGDPAFRKAWLRLFVDTVVVSDTEVRVAGPTSRLAHAAGKNVEEMGAGSVPTFVREWRPVGDSNPCYRRERAVTG